MEYKKGIIVEYHDLQTNNLLDVRRNAGSVVNEDEIIYAVHRVVLGNAIWYHHGVIVSDGLDTTADGLLQLQSNIFAESSKAAKVTPVFLRSLAFTDTQIAACVRQEMNEQIAELLAAGRKDRFMVLGLVGDRQLTLIDIAASDAFMAAANAAEAVNEQHGAVFVPVDVSFALPITEEISGYFFKAADGIKAMLGAVVQHGYVH